MDIFNQLNNEQIDAVKTTEGYVRVIAGAGSGKTKTLTHRYAYLVNELGISTTNILCVTFTNKAANEMKKRIRTYIGDKDIATICTFHGFCLNILREDINVLNYPKNFSILDTDDSDTLLKNVYENLKFRSNDCTYKNAKEFIGKRKLDLKYIEDFIQLNNDNIKTKIENSKEIEEKIFFRYLLEQKKCFALDYDDLINIALYILNTNKEIREKWQKRLMYIMVDEFQDVSSKQYALVNLLSSYHKNLFIVGDPDQTIYSWRGAKIHYILNFDKEHADTKTIKLNKNYRSSPEILNASNSLIKKNKNRIENELVAVKNSSIRVIYNHAKTNSDEAIWIANQIKSLIEKGNNYNDIAILYRAHYVSRAIEEILIKEKIPYTLYSGIEFYKRKEIKDALSYLRLLTFDDDLSFLRIINEPKRNIGNRRISILKEYANKNNCSLYKSLINNLEKPIFTKTKANEFVEIIEKYKKIYKEMNLSDIMTELLQESGYESMLRLSGDQDRLDNLAELKQSLFEFETNSGEDNTLEEYLQNISLLTNLDKKEKESTIKLMTIHSSKGLEFPYVFICGLNEGIFPNKHANTEMKLEEERRLAYVGFTRAEKELFLSDAEGYNLDGTFRYPSRFIFNTDKNCLDYTVELDSELVDESINYIEQSEKKCNLDEIFSIGDIVVHKIFGQGKIIGVDRENLHYTIKFDKYDTERNINIFVDLEKIDKK